MYFCLFLEISTHIYILLEIKSKWIWNQKTALSHLGVYCTNYFLLLSGDGNIRKNISALTTPSLIIHWRRSGVISSPALREQESKSDFLPINASGHLPLLTVITISADGPHRFSTWKHNAFGCHIIDGTAIIGTGECFELKWGLGSRMGVNEGILEKYFYPTYQ